MLVYKGFFLILIVFPCCSLSMQYSALKLASEDLRTGLYMAVETNIPQEEFKPILVDAVQAAQYLNRKLGKHAGKGASEAEKKLVENAAYILHGVAKHLVHADIFNGGAKHPVLAEFKRKKRQRNAECWKALFLFNDFMRACALIKRYDQKRSFHPCAATLNDMRSSFEEQVPRGLTSMERAVETAATIHGAVGVLTANPSLATVNLEVLQNLFVQQTLTRHLPHIGAMLARMQVWGVHPVQVMHKAMVVKENTPKVLKTGLGYAMAPITWTTAKGYTALGVRLARFQAQQKKDPEMQSPLAPMLVGLGKDHLEFVASQRYSMNLTDPHKLGGSLIDEIPSLKALHQADSIVGVNDRLQEVRQEIGSTQASIGTMKKEYPLDTFCAWFAKKFLATEIVPHDALKRLLDIKAGQESRESALLRLKKLSEGDVAAFGDFLNRIIVPEHVDLKYYAEALLPAFSPILVRALISKCHLFKNCLSDCDLFTLYLRASLNRDAERLQTIEEWKKKININAQELEMLNAELPYLDAAEKARAEYASFNAYAYIQQPGSAQIRAVMLAQHVDPIFWYCIPAENRPLDVKS